MQLLQLYLFAVLEFTADSCSLNTNSTVVTYNKFCYA